MSIYDTMQYVTCDVATYCIGQAASMGATLLAAGTKGKRNALPHAEVMIHQVLGGARGTTTDIEIRTKELLRTKKMMNEILHKQTGQPLERIEKDTDRDNFMSANEAKEYGLVDTCWNGFRLDNIPSSRPTAAETGPSGDGSFSPLPLGERGWG